MRIRTIEYIFIVFVVIFINNNSAVARTIEIVTGEWGPYSSETLLTKGFTSEVVVKAFEQENIDVKLSFQPWKRCQLNVFTGRVFAAFPYFKTPDRERTANFSMPIATSKYVFFYRKDKIKKIEFNSIADLRPYKIGGIRGFFYEETLKESGLHIDIASSLDQCFEKLYYGRFDLMPEDELVGWRAIKKLFPGEEHLFVATNNGLLKNDPLFLMVSRTYPHSDDLLEKFNNGLKTLKAKGLYQKIKDKYKKNAI